MEYKIKTTQLEVYESQWLLSSSQGQFQQKQSDEQGGQVPLKKKLKKLLKRQPKNKLGKTLKPSSTQRPKAPHNTTQYIIKTNSSSRTLAESSIITFNSMIGKI